MTDIERLRNWMKRRHLTTKQMAREMNMPYPTVYHAVIQRGVKAGREQLPGNFIVRFVATYGIDEAAGIFAELAQRDLATKPA